MNRIINVLLFAVLTQVLSSCIEFFHPDLGNDRAIYVVDGLITDQEGYQNVSVSMTSTLQKTIYTPAPFCKVKIVDKHGNIFSLDDIGGGHYRAWIEKKFLIPGNSYQVNVITPSGVEIVSDFDQMPESTEIDSIYYIRKDYPTSNLDKTVQGIQFYVDFSRGNSNSRFYRWDIVETWEHHAVNPKTWFLNSNGIWENSYPPDWSRFTCWTTEIVKNIFTLSTKDIVQNNYTMKALHIVDNQTQKLTFGYSTLVSQYAISEPAFIFWDKLRANSTEQGGLYYTQPLPIEGNLRSITNPELDILGFFSASSVKSKRIFVQNVENFEKYQPNCDPPHLPKPDEVFKYMIELEESGTKYVLQENCVECDFFSGVTVKPNYWPY